jgi:hypothetical protein
LLLTDQWGAGHSYIALWGIFVKRSKSIPESDACILKFAVSDIVEHPEPFFFNRKASLASDERNEMGSSAA